MLTRKQLTNYIFYITGYETVRPTNYKLTIRSYLIVINDYLVSEMGNEYAHNHFFYVKIKMDVFLKRYETE